MNPPGHRRPAMPRRQLTGMQHCRGRQGTMRYIAAWLFGVPLSVIVI